MTWHVHEIVRSGNSSGRVRSFDEANNFIVLMDIEGEFKSGDIITGDESGTSGILNNFGLSEEYEGYEYRDLSWELALVDAIYDGTGKLVATEEYFTGLPSQDYQVKNLVKVDV